MVPRAAYVEDAPDIDIPDADVPPTAPTPPPAAMAEPVQPASAVNVFDFLVAEKPSNTSATSLSGTKEPMAMKKEARSIFSQTSSSFQRDVAGQLTGTESQCFSEMYEEHGFGYGAEPVKPSDAMEASKSHPSIEMVTPAPKPEKKGRADQVGSTTESRADSAATSDKKRKRGSPEALDLSTIHAKGHRRSRHQTEDTPMSNPPPSSADTPSLNHSGLTGGLNRLLSDANQPFPPTPDYSDGKEEAREIDRRNRHSRVIEYPASPLKRSRHSKEDQQPGSTAVASSARNRSSRIMSVVGNGSSSGHGLAIVKPAGKQNKESALVRTRTRTKSPEDNPQPDRGDRKVERRLVKVHRPGSVLSSRRESWSHVLGRGEVKSSGGGGDGGGSITSTNSNQRRRGSNESLERRKQNVKAIQYHYPRHRGGAPSVSEDSDSEIEDHSHSHLRSRTRSRHRGHHKSNTHAPSTSSTTSYVRTRSSHPQPRESEVVAYSEGPRLQQRAESFLAYITKGPDSSRGCSMNKALKRWHRDGAGTLNEMASAAGSSEVGTTTAAAAAAAAAATARSKEDEQKELWKALRLRKNDRGEIVVFLPGG